MIQQPVLIDSHAHIYYRDYAGDFEAMLQRAADAGVGAMLVVGTDIESSRESVALAEKYPQLYAAVGVHPHDAGRVTEACYEVIRDLALSSPKVVAIGEIGLDFYRDRSPRNEQEMVFRRMLRLAADLDMPVIIHDRDAHEQVIACLREEGACRGVMHCFSGDAAMAAEAIKMGFYISIPGTITYPANEMLRDVVRSTTIDRMLVETDCPYLTPVPHRGKRNEPAYVRLAAERIAEVKGLSLDDVARITTKNVRDLFGIRLWDQSTKIAYKIRESLYLNITNRCSNRCSFCAKFDDFTVKGHNLLLDGEPSFEEVMAAVGEPSGIEEIVFCGYGEPLIRLDLVRQVAKELKRRGYRIRINTDGQANLVHGRNILPDLAGLIDSISISLNAPDAETYDQLCNTPFGAAGFNSVCDFISAARQHIPEVIASAVTVPGIDIDACRKLAQSLGVEFRVRDYAEVG
ncbi:TatD family hydrolase [Pelotalea chapellei]|uniref:TatD family nuclease-associated radical SAM protein n=1 Tax=Pelotalea chapellei TaxID=44671 RepID=A0ABS5UBF8_9BACT|nr:TatD family hydrolase [Pelotalea chapellei]MBT1073010.1 TatD family nuclease-associated radical SAM protein [Pelotalea chapellei]